VTQFLDARQSLSWANDEAVLLKREIDDFYQGGPYSVKAEPARTTLGEKSPLKS